MDQSSSTIGSVPLDDSVDSDQLIVSPNLRASWVNDHYTQVIIDGKKVRQCSRDGCARIYALSSSHITLKKHWREEHEQESAMKKTRFQFSDDLHTNRLVKMVIDLKLNYTLVEQSSFLKFVESLNPTRKIICRRTLSNIILMKLDVLAFQVTEKLSRADTLALTFDIWSPRRGERSFGCVTAHYLDHDGCSVNLVLNFKRMKHPHDGDTISRFLYKTISRHQLEGRIVAITTDNASNNINAIKKLENMAQLSPLPQGFVHYRCVAHIIDLAVRAGMKCLKSTLEPVRAAILGVRSSGRRRETFIGIQKKLIEDLDQRTDGPLELIEDVDHRWSSCFLMLERAHLLSTAIDDILNTDPKMSSIGNINWPTLELLIAFLKPFYDATQRLCVEKDCNISSVSFVTPKLIDHCFRHQESPVEVIRDVARALGSKLNTYRTEIYHPLVNIAYVLDPRYKTKGFSDDERRLVIGELRTILEATSDLEVRTRSSQPATIFCDDSDNEAETFDELDSYLRLRREHSKTNVYNYWRLASSQMPRLTRIASKVLCIQATSVSSERLFSQAAFVDTVTRNRLLDESVENNILAHSWMKFLDLE